MESPANPDRALARRPGTQNGTTKAASEPQVHTAAKPLIVIPAQTQVLI